MIPTASNDNQDCTNAGFFREPSDCTRFYRCTDPFGVGNYQKHSFECPAGTVFDESVSVCNWPQLAAPCGESPPSPPAPALPMPPPPPPGKRADRLKEIKCLSINQSITYIASLVSGSGEDIVVISPTFSFQCTAQGKRHALHVQRWPKVGPSGLMNILAAVAYHFCPSLLAAFTQPGQLTISVVRLRHSPFRTPPLRLIVLCLYLDQFENG